MPDRVLGMAGTTSSFTGISIAIADSMSWLDLNISWLNVNSSGLGVVVAATMAAMTALFYAASLYLRRIEISMKKEKYIHTIEGEINNRIMQLELEEHERERISALLSETMNSVREL